MKTPLLSLPLLICIHFFCKPSISQKRAGPSPWVISAQGPFTSGYYGVTVANGMIGIISSPQPFQVKDVVLAGA